MIGRSLFYIFLGSTLGLASSRVFTKISQFGLKAMPANLFTSLSAQQRSIVATGGCLGTMIGTSYSMYKNLDDSFKENNKIMDLKFSVVNKKADAMITRFEKDINYESIIKSEIKPNHK